MNKEKSGLRKPRTGGFEKEPSVALKAHLNARGLRLTPQKLAVYQVLQRENYHPTPDMVFEEVRRKFPMMSLGTVYQILDQFSRIGVVRRIASGDQRQRFDGNGHPHAHFVCEGCGRIDDIEDDFVEKFQKRFERKFDFHIRGHYFEFSGLCARCSRHGGREPELGIETGMR